jgi:hypothetical protein
MGVVALGIAALFLAGVSQSVAQQTATIYHCKSFTQTNPGNLQWNKRFFECSTNSSFAVSPRTAPEECTRTDDAWCENITVPQLIQNTLGNFYCPQGWAFSPTPGTPSNSFSCAAGSSPTADTQQHVNRLFGEPGACGGKVNLNWQLANLVGAGTKGIESGPEGVGLAGFEVRRAPAGQFSTQAQKVATVTTNCSALGCADDGYADSGLIPGAKYDYDVRGIKKTGGYDYLSNTVTVTASAACEEKAPPLPTFTPPPVTGAKPKVNFSISANPPTRSPQAGSTGSPQAGTAKEADILKGEKAFLAWRAVADPIGSYCGTWDNKDVYLSRLWKQEGTVSYYVGTSGAAADTMSCVGVWDNAGLAWVQSKLCKYADQRECTASVLGGALYSGTFPACPVGWRPGGTGPKRGDGCVQDNASGAAGADSTRSPQAGGGALVKVRDLVCRPAAVADSPAVSPSNPKVAPESGEFRGTLKNEGKATTAALEASREFALECWGIDERGVRSTEIAREVVKAKVVAPDLIASTPKAEWVSGPKSGKESQNIFAEGATIKITGAVENIGTAGAPATKATWRGTEGVTQLGKVTDFGKLDPVEHVPALGARKSHALSRDIEKLRIGQFQLGICADDPSTSSGQVTPPYGNANELKEDNNCSPAPLKLAVVAAPPLPGQTPQPSPRPSTKVWDGWIKLSGTIRGQGTGDKEQATYGVRYDPNTTRFCGEAWGGEVVGWVTFGPLPNPNELDPSDPEKKRTKAGWICDQTRTVSATGTVLSAPPYRVIPGTNSGDWVRLANMAEARIDFKRLDLLINPYDDTLANQSYKLFGWAWSSNIGWISMSSENPGTDGTIPYAVTMEVKGEGFDKADGRALKGWAWSSNIGWIRFDAQPDWDTGKYLEAPQKPTTLNIGSNVLEGWARACSATIGGDCASATGEYKGPGKP